MTTSHTNRAALQHWTELLTGPSESPADWLHAGRQLYQLLIDVSGLDIEAGENRESTYLPAGKALAPSLAAYCVLDFVRTRVFLRGILKAIQTALKQFPDEQLQILYAGPGPFATLALPLFPLLDPQRVKFTFLEISERSIAYLTKALDAFAFHPWVGEILQDDATTYQAKAATPPHLIIIEMLQAGLRMEPQVAATQNLARQMAPGGILIPQRISVKAGLLHPKRNQERMTSMEGPSGAVFHLLGAVLELSQNGAVPDPQGPEIILDAPAVPDPGFSQLALFTNIQVFGDERLNNWDSALTQHLPLTRILSENPWKQAGFKYLLGPEPHFAWRLIP